MSPFTSLEDGVQGLPRLSDQTKGSDRRASPLRLGSSARSTFFGASVTSGKIPSLPLTTSAMCASASPCPFSSDTGAC